MIERNLFPAASTFKLFSIIVVTTVFMLMGGELIFTPSNPSFGGSSLNSQWMMSEAQAQNEHEIKNEIEFPTSDPLQDFKESLNRQILSRFAQKIVASAFGENTDEKDKLKEGIFNVGDYLIEVSPLANKISITITDIVTGNKTKIEVPQYK